MDADLDGHSFPIAYKPIRVKPGEVIFEVQEDGSETATVLSSEDERDLERWSRGETSSDDRERAKVWADHVSTLDLEGTRRGLDFGIPTAASSLADVLRRVDLLLENPVTQEPILDWCFSHFGLTDPLVSGVRARWKFFYQEPRMISAFAPYAYFVIRVTQFLLFGLEAGLMSSKSTNWIDMQYFYYLPFGQVFCSSDRFHEELFPYLALPGQVFVNGSDLKKDLRFMADAFDDGDRDEPERFVPAGPLTERLWNRFVPSFGTP